MRKISKIGDLMDQSEGHCVEILFADGTTYCGFSDLFIPGHDTDNGENQLCVSREDGMNFVLDESEIVRIRVAD